MDRQISRRRALGVIAVTPVAATGDLVSLGPFDKPRRVSQAEVDQVNEETDLMRKTDLRRGGGHLVEANRSTISDLLKAYEQCPLGMQPSFGSAIAWRAAVLGLCAFDMEDWGVAEDLYKTGTSLALDAHNWSLATRLAQLKARMHTYRGNPTLAIGILEQALTRTSRLGEIERVMLYDQLGRAHAAMGRFMTADTALKTARQHMANVDLVVELEGKPWFGHYDEAHHQGDQGAAYATLAGYGHRTVSDATGAFTTALKGYQHTAVRSILLVQLSLAHVDLTDGNVDRGIRTALTAIDYVPLVESARVIDHVRKVASAASSEPLRNYGPADELREVLGEVLTL